MKLKKISLAMLLLFIFFHSMLILTLNFDFFSKYSHSDYRNDFTYVISCYGIIITMITIFFVALLKSIIDGKSMSYIKNMSVPLACAMIMTYLYYETNIYLQKDIMHYTALICFLLSFCIIIVFLCVKLFVIVKGKSEIDKKKIYFYFLNIDIVILLMVVIGGLGVMNYVQGKIELIVFAVIVHMASTLLVLTLWSFVMWVVYKVID